MNFYSFFENEIRIVCKQKLHNLCTDFSSGRNWKRCSQFALRKFFQLANEKRLNEAKSLQAEKNWRKPMAMFVCTNKLHQITLISHSTVAALHVK